MAAQLRSFLEREESEIDRAHVHGAKSSALQVIISRLLTRELGFREEISERHEIEGLTVQPRPDFVFRLGPARGILAEVERGGTTTNNHDLKDFWKAHLATDAHHLFLVVPHANWTAAGQPREKPFHAVRRRLAAFFGDSRREVDVLSAHIFGYGRFALDA